MFVKVDEATIRKEINGEMLGNLKTGTKLEVQERKDGWVKVKMEGWIKEDSLTDNPKKISRSIGTKISGGFVYKNIKFKSSMGMIKAIGELTNNSGTDYSLANFIISVYDENGSLIGSGYINISNFLEGQTKTFNALIDAPISEIKKYKIQFENGI